MRAILMLFPLLVAQDKPVDIGKVLRESKEFAARCGEFKITYGKGVVRAAGEIHYRGGGPCEYLVAVYPAKAHETIVLLDKGPYTGKGARPREYVRGLAEVLNNAFFAAGFEKGKPFDWDEKQVFPPRGTVTHVYAEWKDTKGRDHRALISDWLWNYKNIEVMEKRKLVFTGSQVIDEGPPTNKKWLGAEIEGIVVGVLNTASAIIDNTEDGSLDNGAYEAIPIRIPEAGTRITVAFSREPLQVTENYPPLKLPKEAIEAKKRLEAEKARKKREAGEKKKEGEKKDR